MAPAMLPYDTCRRQCVHWREDKQLLMQASSRRPSPMTNGASSSMGIDPSAPVILLGGRENTVALARNLGRLGVRVVASGRAGCRAMNSRYCSRALPVPAGVSAHEYWSEILLSNRYSELNGSLILVGCDESLEFVEANCEALRARYIVEHFIPELRRAMLDKQATLSLARKVDVPTPSFWPIRTDEDVFAIRDEIRFPVMVKPLNSHTFMEEFGRKLFIVQDSFDKVAEMVALCRSRGHEVMVVEMIPGPDSLLSSYYTYRTPEGVRLYDYTKSVIRRWPVNRGGACFHQSEWLPETAEMGRRLFDGIGWQGIANVEFKRDPRDGQLKLIEVNARFTAAHRLVTEAGAPIDVMIYCYLTGQPGPFFENYRQSLRLWDPIRDFLAFRQLNKRGQLGLAAWLKSIFTQKLILSYFSLADPGPGLAEFWANCKAAFANPAKLMRKAGQNAN